MSDSGAVYQPTTVGYTYDSGGNGAGGSGGIRNNFWRIMSRHKISSRKWIEWVLLSVGLCFFVAGLTTMLVSLVSADDSPTQNEAQTPSTTTEVEEQINDGTHGCIAFGASMMLGGLLLGFVWAWFHFFRHSKSPRNGMSGSSGQMLGGLNPSTDLLVGSTSQYGPVLTELPSQLKMKQTNTHDVPSVPLSDQEEETRTLMQDSTSPPSISVGPTTVTNQIPG